MDPQYPGPRLNKKLIYPLIAVVVGITGFFVFSLLSETNSLPIGQVQQPKTSVVIIPKGSSLQSQAVHLVPQNITVVIGVNNTVEWINQDDVGVAIESDTGYVDKSSGAFDSTDKQSGIPGGYILPSKSFNFTFTEPGTYGYGTIPHPFVQGTVIVKSS